MTITASIYRINGSVETISSASKKFSLQDLKKAVSGRIQSSRMDKTQHFIYNEEGHLLGLQINPHFHQFVGDVVLINKKYY